jgi:hypothetical protein
MRQPMRTYVLDIVIAEYYYCTVDIITIKYTILCCDDCFSDIASARRSSRVRITHVYHSQYMCSKALKKGLTA